MEWHGEMGRWGGKVKGHGARAASNEIVPGWIVAFQILFPCESSTWTHSMFASKRATEISHFASFDKNGPSTDSDNILDAGPSF